MKAVFASVLATLVALSINVSAGAQTRAVGAHELVLDDGSGHTLTIQTSTMGSNQTFTFPAVTTYTPGSVLFADGSGSINQNNGQFFWDNTHNRLGIGNAAPAYALDVTGDIHASGVIHSGSSLVLDGVSTPRSLTGDATTNITTTAGDIDITPFGNLNLTPNGGATAVTGVMTVTGNTHVGGFFDAVHYVAAVSASAPSANAGVTVTDVPVFIITPGAATAPFGLTMPGTATTGDMIVVINQSAYAADFGTTGKVIPLGSRTFYYDGTAWQ